MKNTAPSGRCDTCLHGCPLEELCQRCEREIVEAIGPHRPERILAAFEAVAIAVGSAKRVNIRTGKPVVARRCTATSCPSEIHWFGAQSRTITRDEALARIEAEKAALR